MTAGRSPSLEGEGHVSGGSSAVALDASALDLVVAALAGRDDRRGILSVLSRFSVLVIGEPREGDGPPLAPDAHAVAAVLARLLPATGILWTATPGDLPYNLARRSLTLDHLSDARAGVVFGALPDDPEEERIRVVRDLWNSWPVESLIADRERGVFAETDGIRAISHAGPRFPVAGALATPSSRQGEPVSAWVPRSPGAVAAVGSLVDLVIVDLDGGDADDLRSAARSAGAQVLLRGDDSAIVGAEAVPGERPLRLLGASAIRAAVGAVEPPRGLPAGSLRERLGLRPRRLDLSDRPRAFGGVR